MPYFNIVASTSENTVVTEYVPVKSCSDTYQSEAELEKEFIQMLGEQGYEYLPCHSEAELIQNLRHRLSELNNYEFSDTEWNQFFTNVIASQNSSIVEKTRMIQEEPVQLLKKDDGSSKNIRLIDKDNIHNNKLQVINQYAISQDEGAKHNNRYDVTILINGLPIVHTELKRRGVAIREAFNQIERYQRDSFQAGYRLFEYVQIFVISNGTNTKYYSNSTRWNAIKDAKNTKKYKTSNSFEFTCCWADANNRSIPDLVDFTRTFFAKHTLLNILTKYCVLTAEGTLLVMRPYQITATERIINRIETANNYKKYGTVAGGGYIWHTTGSGKTLTSFKTARIASRLDFIDKVLFVVDRKDLDYQTMKEYDRFEKGAANSNSSTAVLTRQLSDPKAKIIITTIQKLSNFIAKNKTHIVYDQHVVIIFDECHRSQFGNMHTAIVKAFKKYHLFGFTGTPIFAMNAGGLQFFTTKQIFGDQLHTYTIVNAINDNNVLPFRVDYVKTMKMDTEVIDEQVWDINREQALMAPQRIQLITQYILDHFDQKTYRGNNGNKTYTMNVLTNIKDVVSAKHDAVEELKQQQRLSGFNSIFAVSSIQAAKLYYAEFKKQMKEDPTKKLRIALIYSYATNEAEGDNNGLLGEENSEDTSALDVSSRDFLGVAINDYNLMFHTNYSTDRDKFQNYYKDVSFRMKNKEIDLLIVVNMFLTGFDSTTLNTLWVDKNLKLHGIIQAFSRTNRILNSIKTFGNIVCFRNLAKCVDVAVSLFGNKDASGIVLMKSFNDYYNGYEDEKGILHPGYRCIVNQLQTRYPLSEPDIVDEQSKKNFVKLFGAFLRVRNILSAFDELEGYRLLSERDLQEYMGRYQDTYQWLKDHSSEHESTDIVDDIVYEIELIKQIEISIDYILLCVAEYNKSYSKDKGIFISSIQKAIDSSPTLRSKRVLIEGFIKGFIDRLSDIDAILNAWRSFVAKSKEKKLGKIIQEERLKPKETRRFIEDSFQSGELKTTGTNIDKLLPPVSRFGSSGNRAKKKEVVIEKLKKFFEMFLGIV